MDDLISRLDAIDTRRYTFGNDEFSLEAAYHDCKLVFDGITDDESFQEADTGLILYYANEIIYALHEALEGKDANILSNDCISRQAAIEALREGFKKSPTTAIRAMSTIKILPSAQPERKRGNWKYNGKSGTFKIFTCDQCGRNSEAEFNFCPDCGVDMRGDSDEAD